MKKNLKRETSAGAIIFYDENDSYQYLLLRYATKDKYWGFPKGLVEENIKETTIQTAIREIYEETGISAHELKFVNGFKESLHYFFQRSGTSISKKTIYCLARFLGRKKSPHTPESLRSSIRLSGEHLEFAWLPYQEASKRLTHKNHREILTKAENFLKNE